MSNNSNKKTKLKHKIHQEISFPQFLFTKIFGRQMLFKLVYKKIQTIQNIIKNNINSKGAFYYTKFQKI